MTYSLHPFPLSILLAIFPFTALAISTSQQGTLFQQIQEFVSNSNPSFLSHGPKPGFLLSTASQAATLSTQESTTGDTLFGNDFSVTPSNNEADPLSEVAQQTQAIAEEIQQQPNPQEERLENKADEPQAPAAPSNETTGSQTEPDITLNPSMNPNLADRIDEIRDSQGLPGVNSVDFAEALENEKRKAEGKSVTPGRTKKEAEPHINEITEVVTNQNAFFGEGNIPLELGSVKYAVLIGIALTLFVIIVVYLRDFFNKYCNPILVRRISHASRDVAAILLIVTLVFWLRFQGVVILNVPMNKICLCCSVFALCWFIWCIFLVMFAQAHSVNWEEKEIQRNNKEKILYDYREYSDRRLHGDSLTSEEKKKFAVCQSEIQYLLLRQNFITPSYLPILTESILREDFNFAYYLTLCLEKVLANLFQISIATIFSGVIVVIFWGVITAIKNDVAQEIVFGAVIPVASFFILFVLKRRLTWINEELRTPIDDPRKIEFIRHDVQRDPYANLQNPLPGYLHKIKDSESVGKSFFSQQKRANYQETLFWFSSPHFSIVLLHILAVCQITWAIIYSGYYLLFENTAIGFIYSGILAAIFFFNVLFMIPSSFIQFSIVANVEMKKDRESVRKTVAVQKKLLKDALVKLYRLLKSAKRELSDETSAGIRLRDFSIKLIKESFRRINPNSWEVEIQDLPKLTHLCGSELEKDELVYLARCASQDLQTVIIDDFILTIERMTKDVKLDPYQTSHEVLKSLNPREDEMFVLKELKELLLNHKVLPVLDIEEILHELKYYSADNTGIGIASISSLIRNTIEESMR